MTASTGQMIDVIEATAWNGRAEVVLRFATLGFMTLATDTPASTTFDERVTQAATITRVACDDQRTSGRSRVAVGDVVLNNRDGGLDQYKDYGFDGRSLVVRRGLVGAAYPAGFDVLAQVTMQGAVFSATDVVLKIRDAQQRLSTLLQPTLYGGTNVLPAGVDGTSDIQGKPLPVLLGTRRNIAPVLVNASKLIYQVNDGAIASIDDVRDRGVSLGGGLAWSQRTFPQTAGDNLYGCAYGNSMYVVVGMHVGGAVAPIAASSPDGVTWTLRASATVCALAAGFGNGIFVVVGAPSSPSNVMTSADGITWTSRTSATTRQLQAVAYSPGLGLWVAVGQGGTIQTSPDGVTWTLRTSGTTQNLYGVCAGRRQFTAVGDSTTILTSLDGITWTPRTVALATVHYNACAYDSTRGWFASGIDYAFATGVGTSAHSDDGVTWYRLDGFMGTDSISSIAPGISSAQPVLAVAHSSANLGSSQDGITWTKAASLPGLSGGAATQVQCVAMGNNDYLAVGYDTTGANIWQGSGGAASVYGTLADLLDDSKAPQAGTYKAYIAGGLFRIGLKATGQLLCDASEGTTAADRTTAQVFKRFLTRSGFATGEYSASDITAFDLLNSAVVGHYFTDPIVRADALDEILSSTGAWSAPDRLNVLRLKRLSDPLNNLVRSASRLNTAPWVVTANAVVTEDFANYAQRSMSRITYGATQTGSVVQNVTFRTTSPKIFQFRVKSNGATGTDEYGIYDQTANTIRCLVIATFNSNGTISFSLSVGTGLVVTLLDDGVYFVRCVSTAVVIANVNQIIGSAALAYNPTGVRDQLVGDFLVSETPVAASFVQDEFLQDSFNEVPSQDTDGDVPRLRTTIQYSPNNNVATTDLAAATTVAQRALNAAEWLAVSTPIDAVVQAAHLFAPSPVESTHLALSADALAEATRRQALHGIRRRWYTLTVELNSATSLIDLGDTIYLTADRFGLSIGGYFVVLGVLPDTGANHVTFSIWG